MPSIPEREEATASIRPPRSRLLMMQDGKSRPAIIAALVALCEQPSAVVESGVDGFFKQMASYVS
jgi:6-phosphogluconate dehydrogenase